ncbi:hypothetical protein [Adlercreutzia caecimuris]|uniref:hypothetical protein n=1 Tax=Adlercreutzia caecimuris TaxID=671266 RepID=UPI001C3DCA40|nr:hypothetical protein [Adlercreutzia caecimuris]MCR2037997.1 hypothetical protein [Adlercreutzia caecimuris]
MPRKIVELEYESDENRPGVSHKRAGSNSPNFYDEEGNLVETATYRDIDEDELRERYREDSAYRHEEEEEPYLTEHQKQIAEFLGALIVEIAIAASPYIKNWWLETAFPGIKGFFGKTTSRIKANLSKHDAVLEVEAKVIESSRMLPSAENVALELKKKDEAYCIDMSSEEAQRNLIELIALASLMAKKMDILSHARITDENGVSLEEVLRSENILRDINQILLDNPDVLSSQTLKGLETAFNRSLFTAEGKLIPIEAADIRRLLSDSLNGEDGDDGLVLQ